MSAAPTPGTAGVPPRGDGAPAPTPDSSGALAALDRATLAALAPEYLLAGGVIDRVGMPHVIAAGGREAMAQVAIEEWMGASPIYAKRMQRALGFESDSVETIFKAMQFDVGAVPQYMDFRYLVHDHDHGEFWLDHCGALMDVEPMGDDYVVAMCHTIEDPTFDATAAATNPRARVRPLHRPPRSPADRHPHCHWTVTIADEHPALTTPAEAVALAASRAASIELSPIDPDEPGRSDYSGPLVDDVRFEDWSRTALVRIIEEVCLAGHLLVLAYRASAAGVTDETAAVEMMCRQFTGAAGLAAQRLRDALGLGSGLEDAATLLGLHPALLPHRYVGAQVERGESLVLRLDAGAPAMLDGAWPAVLDVDNLAPLDAIVWAIDPRMACRVTEATGTGGLTVEVVVGEHTRPESPDVGLARMSGGATMTFADRGAPVELLPGVRPRRH